MEAGVEVEGCIAAALAPERVWCWRSACTSIAATIIAMMAAARERVADARSGTGMVVVAEALRKALTVWGPHMDRSTMLALG